MKPSCTPIPPGADVARREALLALIAVAACGGASGVAGAAPLGESKAIAGLRLTRIYTGDDGRSHFEDIDLKQHQVRTGVVETDWFAAKRASLRFLTPAEDFKAQSRHVAPRRQVAVILTGALEVECADSATRRFESGAVVLLEDVRGEGHITRVAQSPCTFVNIELADNDAAFPFVKP